VRQKAEVPVTSVKKRLMFSKEKVSGKASHLGPYCEPSSEKGCGSSNSRRQGKTVTVADSIAEKGGIQGGRRIVMNMKKKWRLEARSKPSETGEVVA